MTLNELRTQMLLDNWVAIPTYNRYEWIKQGVTLFINHDGICGVYATLKQRANYDKTNGAHNLSIKKAYELATKRVEKNNE